VNAIHAKYPEIKFIANHWQGGYPSTPKRHRGTNILRHAEFFHAQLHAFRQNMT